MKDILFTSFESLPFVKVGGLADVVYALPKAIDNKRYRVKVILPLFKNIKESYKTKLKYVTKVKVATKLINTTCNIYSLKNESIEYLFVENNKYYNRKNVYSYDDDLIRYSLFCLAVVEMMIKLDYYPDICHEHDYHTSMISAICKIKYADNKNISNIKHIFTIHNLVYQGWYKKNILKNCFGFDKKNYKEKDIIIKNYVNFMKAGICYSDAVTTVSNTYAKEIQTHKYGCGLDKLLTKNKNKLFGIVNGIDTSLFNPLKDKNIKYKYDIHNYQLNKYKNKMQLQKELHLDIDSDVLLVGMVSRLTFQKGADLILKNIKKILNTNVQIAILGTGEDKFEKEFTKLSLKYKGRFAYYRGYNESLAHRMYAGLDTLFMPSLFEPCGISQLIALRYGTISLVRKTGGLKDTIHNYSINTSCGNGFSFSDYKAKEFYKAYLRMYKLYYSYPNEWHKLIKKCMKIDVSFAKSAKEYELIYKKLINN